MKTVLAFLAVAGCALAQEIEKVPDEEAQKIAGRIAAVFGAPADAPFAIDVNLDKPCGLKAGESKGLLLIPDKKLSVEVIAATGREIVPVAQLWMRKVVPAVNGAAPEPGKLRSVEFGEGDQKRVAEVYYLGLTKTDAGALELGLYAKDKTAALVKVPFVKTDAAANDTVLAVSGRKEDENTGVLVLTVFGNYKADITVTRPRE